MALIKSITEAIAAALRRPGKADALRTEQTAVPEGTPQRAMLASVKRALAEHPSKGLTPARLYRLLEAAEGGDLVGQHSLFADMEEKDPQIASDLGKRKNAAAELEWQIDPPDSPSRAERKAADLARALFGALEVEDLIIDLGDAIGHGWCCLELAWARDGEQRVIAQPQWRPHTWFQTPREVYDTLTLRDGSLDGEALWPLGWVQHRHRAKSGYLSRLGLHRTLVWPYLFQSYALGDLAELLEILGIPARLGKYPSAATAEEKATLLSAVTQLGHSAAGIIPEGMAIEYLEAAKADGATHQVMLQWCEKAKSKAILGGTLTTATDGAGSYAMAQVHERGLDSLVAADARQYAATIRRDILWPLAALNYGVTDLRRAPRWYLDTGQVEDYEVLAKSLPTFVDLGARVPLWWLHEKTRIPLAEDGEEALTRSGEGRVASGEAGEDGGGAATAPDGSARLASLALATRHSPLALDQVDLMTERLAREAQPAVDAMVAQVRAMVDAAGSLEELLAMIEAAYPALDAGPLAAVMTQAGLAAELAGMAEVADEAASAGLPPAPRR